MNAIDSAMELDGILNKNAETARPANICRAIVCRISDSGAIVVQVVGGSDAFFTCDILQSGGNLGLKAGDPVLVVAPSSAEDNGVILGLIGPYRPPASISSPAEHLTVEASESLALKCGDGSIELRKDGKVLVKGKDIVSYASRVQRIKGGTVSIN